MNKDKIRVMLLDDHPAIRQGIAMSIDIEEDMYVAYQCSGAHEALKFLSSDSADIILVDISLEGSADGFDFIKAVRDRFPSAKCLVLSMFDEAVYAEKALHYGAMGYITKKEPVEVVIRAIRQVVDGGLYLPKNISDKLIMKFMKQGDVHEGSEDERLTPKEKEILHYIGRGYSPGEIAKELKLSVNTVESHRRKMKLKLGFESSKELTKYAIKYKDM